MNFEPYPFEKLNYLLKDITPNPNCTPSTLTIGEPQRETPKFIQERLCMDSSLLRKYPKTTGESELRDAQKLFVKKRFGVKLKDAEIIPTFGIREVLFNFPQFLLFDKKDPTMAFTNPFHQIYEGAAITSRAKIIHINMDEANDFKPKIDEDALSKCDLVIINSPNNPTASTLSLIELVEWIKLSQKYNFTLINDECYSELYTDEKIPSLLEAAIMANNSEFKNILVVNSISKCSSAPGLHSGFIAGDAKILKEYMNYRTYVGCTSSLPLQSTAAITWSDEDHINPVRENTKGINPAKNDIRIALVEPPKMTRDALSRIKECLV